MYISVNLCKRPFCWLSDALQHAAVFVVASSATEARLFKVLPPSSNNFLLKRRLSARKSLTASPMTAPPGTSSRQEPRTLKASGRQPLRRSNLTWSALLDRRNSHSRSTLTAEIEAALNSRPLSPLSADPQDLSALMPGHFLISSALLASPEPFSDEHIDHCPIENHCQMRKHFWRRWRKEIMHHMQ